MDIRYPKRSFFSPYVPWRLLGILSLIYLVIIVYYLARSVPLADSTHPQPSLYIAVLISIVCPLISGIFCLKGSLRYLKHPPATNGVGLTCRFTPPLLGWSRIVFAISQMILLGRLLVTQKLPEYPYVSHFIGLLPHILLIIGVLLLPTRRLFSFLYLRILLNSLIIMVAVTTLCYYFLLAPLLVHGDGTIQAKLVGSASPALGLFLMFCVLVIALRSDTRILRPVLVFLGLATILQFIADVIHLYELLYHNYNEFSIANVGLIIFGFLLIGAAQTINAILNNGQATEGTSMQGDDTLDAEVRWKIVLPSVLVLVFGLLICFIYLKGSQSFPGQIIIVYIGGSGVLVLALVCQFLTLYQIDCLKKKLQAKNSALDTLNGQLEKQATTDALTGLPNHCVVAEKLDEALERARKTATSCSVIFLDVDHFKATNDRYGHLLGDAVLRLFAQVVTKTVRVGDTVGRWGGEEFVVVLPEMGSEEAFQAAEQIRVAVNCSVSQRACVSGLTCSLGVATYPQDASEREDLVKRADQAMYAAKRLGRNQTRTACKSSVLAIREAAQLFEKREVFRMSETTEALLTLVEVRDPALSRHARRVAALSLKIARELGLSHAEAYIIGLGGLLHDLGSIAMPDEVLFKRDESNESAFENQARYLRIGAEILAPVHALKMIATIVGAHCERVDGSGYPAGLRGEEIPLGARIVAVANAYDATLGERVFRRTRASASILKELRRAAGSHFDPRVIEALVRVLAVAPRLSRVNMA
ncbi:MAG TPA: diguanylate cyclase [Ktedonobacteraceae bacterium]|jgi:diguanylate cyclase (GGDEF)-like protein